MSRTVTALYDTRAEAEAASQRLSAAFDVEGKAKIIDKSSMGSSGSDFHNVPLSHEDRHSYGEGLRRGGFMLCAEVDGDEDTDKIVRVLEETSSVDMDEREQSWRSEGWSPFSGASGTGGGFGATSGTSSQQGMSSQQTDTSRASGNVVQEEHIPIVEEQLVVGKREVNRGGARVRTYVKEMPVHEQVSLREEHVSVERRPVNETLKSGDLTGDMLQERTVEMTEMAEEAVVAKEARVREELVIKKTAEQRTEEVEDTVRRTEVEVDEGRSGDRPAMGFGRDNNSGTTGSTNDYERANKDRDI
jgi:uncharacterized protein (TIGR02271 family)